MVRVDLAHNVQLSSLIILKLTLYTSPVDLVDFCDAATYSYISARLCRPAFVARTRHDAEKTSLGGANGSHKPRAPWYVRGRTGESGVERAAVVYQGVLQYPVTMLQSLLGNSGQPALSALSWGGR